jgi:hypothetical protein
MLSVNRRMFVGWRGIRGRITITFVVIRATAWVLSLAYTIAHFKVALCPVPCAIKTLIESYFFRLLSAHLDFPGVLDSSCTLPSLHPKHANPANQNPSLFRSLQTLNQ